MLKKPPVFLGTVNLALESAHTADSVQCVPAGGARTGGTGVKNAVPEDSALDRPWDFCGHSQG